MKKPKNKIHLCLKKQNNPIVAIIPIILVMKMKIQNKKKNRQNKILWIFVKQKIILNYLEITNKQLTINPKKQKLMELLQKKHQKITKNFKIWMKILYIMTQLKILVSNIKNTKIN